MGNVWFWIGCVWFIYTIITWRFIGMELAFLTSLIVVVFMYAIIGERSVGD